MLMAWLLSGEVVAQDAGKADRNTVNTSTRPGSMMADSPVKFPEIGGIPSKYPPDIKVRLEESEPDSFIYPSPRRSLEQINRIQQEMPRGTFTIPSQDWKGLQRTHEKLIHGGGLHILALGDSILSDTMRSGWVTRLQQIYPKVKIKATVYVRGGGGSRHYREDGRVLKYIIPRKPDLVFIGGISQREDIDAIRDVIHQIRKGLPEVEFLLASGVFGTVDPRQPESLARAEHSGSSDYGAALEKLAGEENCAYIDMTTPWAEYIRSTRLHPHLFYRDPVHANAHGEQILSKILISWLKPREN